MERDDAVRETSLRETLSNTWNCSNKLQLYVVNITISNIMLLLTEDTCVYVCVSRSGG